MNWTGGDLMRAAPTKAKTLKQKQKAHFARARTAAAAHQQRSSNQRLGGLDPQYSSTLVPIPAQDRQHSTPKIDSDEYRLLLKRQELLRRPDWLDLQLTKPLQIAFAASSEKALIGKRRKLRRGTDRKILGVARGQQDPLVGLPVRGLVPRHISSQQDASFRIKVGTNALDSQLQPSTLSTNVRGTSLDVESLSEEPMLLDSDDDLFEQATPYGSIRDVDHAELEHPQARLPPVAQMVATAGKSAYQDQYSSSDQVLPWSTSSMSLRRIKHVDEDIRTMELHPLVHTATGVEDLSDQRRSLECKTANIVARVHENLSAHPAGQDEQQIGQAVDHVVLQKTAHQRPEAWPEQAVRTAVLPVELPPELVASTFELPVKAPPEQVVRTVVLPDKSSSAQVTNDQAQEELWRQFILGDDHSDSEDSVPNDQHRKAHLALISSPKPLQPLSLYRSDEEDCSVVATRGAQTCIVPSSKFMAGPNSSLDGMASSTPFTVKTTAALAGTSFYRRAV